MPFRQIILKLTAVFVLTVSAFSADVSDPQQSGFLPAKLADLERHFQGYVDDNKLAGLTTLIARRGKLVHFKAYGMLDKAAGKAMPDNAVFRIYSMTKPVTGIAMMMLWEEGKFKLDDPVSKYLPEFKNQSVFSGLDDDGKIQTVPLERDVTIRDLMRHTAGLTYGVFGDTPVDRAYRGSGIFSRDNDLKTMVEKIAEQPLLYQPGKAWVYSLATDVQGRLIEVMSGTSLDKFFHSRIFAPLKMTDTSFVVRADQKGRFAEIYAVEKEKGLTEYRGDNYRDYSKNPNAFSGGGGLVSTTMDYWKFAQMVANGGTLNGVMLVKSSTIDLMRSDQLPEALGGVGGGNLGLGFGLNFAVVKDITKAKSAGRVGEYFWGGLASTLFWIDPEEEVVAILMTNFMHSRVYPLRQEMRTQVYSALAD
ncbi:MAG: beta-lactamase family protein [Kordiimonadaceae bacterium]|nr:beta-lactamase family protein [Kordiimonadaceae bacterium]